MWRSGELVIDLVKWRAGELVIDRLIYLVIWTAPVSSHRSKRPARSSRSTHHQIDHELDRQLTRSADREIDRQITTSRDRKISEEVLCVDVSEPQLSSESRVLRAFANVDALRRIEVMTLNQQHA
jgi:hypothetical protein